MYTLHFRDDFDSGLHTRRYTHPTIHLDRPTPPTLVISLLLFNDATIAIT